MRLLGKKKDAPSEREALNQNDSFVTLMQVAREDEEIKTQLSAILALDDFNRRSMLNNFIQQMRLQNAPAEFVSAITCLLDDRIARKAKTLLRP